MRVLKGHTVHSVVALSTNGSNAEAVTTRAIEIVNGNFGTTGNSDTVILVINGDVLQSDIVTGGNVESVAVMSSSVITTGIIGFVTCRVIQSQSRNGEVLNTVDIETVDGPILDFQVGDLGVIDVLDHNKVVGSKSKC